MNKRGGALSSEGPEAVMRRMQKFLLGDGIREQHQQQHQGEGTGSSGTGSGGGGTSSNNTSPFFMMNTTRHSESKKEMLGEIEKNIGRLREQRELMEEALEVTEGQQRDLSDESHFWDNVLHVLEKVGPHDILTPEGWKETFNHCYVQGEKYDLPEVPGTPLPRLLALPGCPATPAEIETEETEEQGGQMMMQIVPAGQRQGVDMDLD